MNSVAYQEGYEAGRNPQQCSLCPYKGQELKDWQEGMKAGMRDYKKC